MMRPVFFSAMFLACGFAAAPAAAHDSPEHVVEALTAQMAKTGPTADLLYRRAVEYRALRKYAEAEADFEASLALDLNSFATTFALAEILATQKKWQRCIELVEPLTTAKDQSLRAAGLSLRGRIRAAQGDWNTALADFEAAMELDELIETYLLRAKAHAELYERSKQIEGLRQGWTRTESPVLLRVLCDALIDAEGKHLAEAMTIVNREAAESRYRSAWLLRRARLHLIQNNRAEAIADLQAALSELNARLDTPRPDPTLEWERTAAEKSLQEPDKALAYLSISGGIPPLRLFAPEATAAAPRTATRVEP